MSLKSKKFVSLLLIFSLMMFSVNLYAKERRGAKLIVTKKDGQLIEGELITVKPNSLLLLDTEGKDVSVVIADIKVIRVVKKSKALLGAGIGLLGGALIGRSFVDEAEDTSGLDSLAAFFSGGIIGGAIGLLTGASVGKDKTIQIEGMTDSEIQETLDKLRKKARIRDYK